MSERTQLALGSKSLSVPKLTKRLIEIAVSTALTAVAMLAILTTNNLLIGKNGWERGYSIWINFIQRSDILGTVILTATVTVAFVYWYRARDRG
ncbi:MAG: hypothetical protein AAF732_21970 [Pseudomonadota bacterium]